MTRVVLDTSIYIDWLNRGLHAELLLGRDRVRYLSAVVLMELYQGATSRPARRALAQLASAYEAHGRLVAPSPAQFRWAGALLRTLKRDGMEVRRASLVNDVLVALTARALGAALVTRDGGDFEAVRRRLPVDLRLVRD